MKFLDFGTADTTFHPLSVFGEMANVISVTTT